MNSSGGQSCRIRNREERLCGAAAACRRVCRENHMLRSLRVRNMALIDEEEIEFSDRLNILTGETGAGKSILIGSIGVALGAGSFRDFVPKDAEHASVELVFETDTEQIRERLEEEGIPDMDGEVAVSRTYHKGRSISRINGESVSIGLVKEISSMLIDIHGQHEHQSLLYPKYHLQLVDDYAGDAVKGLKEECAAAYHSYSDAQRKLLEARKDEKDRLKKIDFIRYEVDEIDGAALTEGEDDELESRFRLLSHAQKITEALSQTQSLTDSDGEDDASGKISRAVRSLASVADYDEGLGQLYEMLSQTEELMNDFGRSLSEYLDDFSYDEQEFNDIGSRLDLINRLKAKYGKTISQILAYRDSQEKELERLTDFDAYVDGLKKKMAQSAAALSSVCTRITSARKKAAAELTALITASLKDLNFLDVRFEIHFDLLKEPGENGADEVCFLISTNPGMPLRPLQDVASGGELSRIMLGIKTVMAKRDEIGCLIFDEIDTGISGRTAQKVSEKMAQLSRDRQVIAITHLAQIASMADSHYLIEKYTEEGRTHTGVRRLDEEQSVAELARILGGVQITDSVMQSAAEMKKLADARKRQFEGETAI